MKDNIKLDFVCSYWDDPKGLFRMLDSIPSFVNTVFVRDGRYSIRTDEPEYTQAMTDAVIKEFNSKHLKGKLHYSNNKNLETQIEKRNNLWDKVEKDNPDYCIVIDSDEYMDIDEDLLYSELVRLLDYPYPCIPIKNMYMVQNYRIPRLFKPPFNFRHIKRENGISHGSLYNPDGIEIINTMHKYDEICPPKRGKPEHSNGIEGITFYHKKNYYSDKRMMANEIYYSTDTTR